MHFFDGKTNLWQNINWTYVGQPETPSFPRPDQNRSGGYFSENFLGSGRGILFWVGPVRGIFYQGMRHFSRDFVDKREP